MSQTLNLNIDGLYTYPNNLNTNKVPEGALEVAENIDISRPGIAETRRGQKKYGIDLIDPKQMFQFENTILVNDDDKLKYDSDGIGTWVAFTGDYTQPDPNSKMRGITSSKNFYFTTDAGVYRLTSIAGQPQLAGVPEALNPFGASLTGATGFLANGFQVAYRMIWVEVDANDNLHLGAPSDRLVIANSSGGTRDVQLSFTIPFDITTAYTFRIYRSKQTTTPADDDLFLVAEGSITGTDISNKFFTITDSVPDSLQGVLLYTSPNAEQITQANARPPFCKDMELFNNHVWYANYTTKQNIEVNLLSAGGGSGLQNNDTITIDSVVYTAKTAGETIASGFFQLFTAGTPAQNIENTANSLVNVVNRYTSNTTIYGRYTSNFDQQPGHMLFTARNNNTNPFAVTSSHGGVWNPILPSSGTTVSSSNDSAPNGLFMSKINQPEAVPIVNNLLIGSASEPIIRIIATKDSLFVFKTEGVWRITGTGDKLSDFSSQLFNTNVKVIGPETVVTLDNQIFVNATQGVTAISAGEPKIVSYPIFKDLIQLSQLSNYPNLAFAVSYESESQYILFSPTSLTDTACTIGYVFNIFTRAWTTRTYSVPRACGIVFPSESDGKLYMAGKPLGYVP